jgi:type IV secretion system protein VirB10
MVLDTSSPTTIQPHVAPGAHVAGQPGAAGSQQALSENEAFGARVGGGGVDVASASRMADPANTVTQGTLIPAILETAIDSDLPGYVRAVVSQDVRSFDGSRVLIPRSTRLIGQYKSGLSAGQTRAYVMWTRLIRPDGASVALASPAIDFAGRTGLTGQVNSHFMKRFGSAMLMSVVGGLGTLAGGTSVTLSSGQSAASVAAQRDSTIPPTIRVPQGQPIRVFTARDLDFSTVAQGQEPIQ